MTFIANIRAIKSEWPEDRKTPKGDVSYTDHSTNMSEQCQSCENFIAPSRCRTVKGPIALTGWCERYEYAR